MRTIPALALSALFLTGCAAHRPLVAPKSSAWKEMATEADRDRLRDWRQTLTDALTDARNNGFGAQVDAEGALLLPDSTLGGGLPSGAYRCRTLKIGANFEGQRHFTEYPPTPCEVTPVGKVQWFSVLSGVQRPAGFIYAGDRLHGVFLGALSLGDEKASMRYGVDPDRDMAGWVDRIGDARWRIVLPKPHFESQADIIELILAAD